MATEARLGLRVMTLDHKAAYLNDKIKGQITMILMKEVANMLIDINPSYNKFLRPILSHLMVLS